MDFELKLREISMSWISVEIHWEILELWNLVKFGQQAPYYTLLQGKNKFPAKGDQKFEF
jgi:hypothetical protein